MTTCRFFSGRSSAHWYNVH